MEAKEVGELSRISTKYICSILSLDSVAESEGYFWLVALVYIVLDIKIVSIFSSLKYNYLKNPINFKISRLTKIIF